MNQIRLIAKLDIKNEHVIKGIHMEGLRKVGDPVELARRYYDAGIDEIIMMDAVASLYGRNNLFHIVESACEQIFIPITIGGGIRSIDDINQALRSGADKVAINTAAIRNPEFIAEAAKVFGSQCIVGSIEAKRKGDAYEAYIETGRQETGVDAVAWAKRLVELGAGEIFLTSIDQEGTKGGFDLNLMQQVGGQVKRPVIACGGAGALDHFVEACLGGNAEALATASFLHYQLGDVHQIKAALRNHGVRVRA